MENPKEGDLKFTLTTRTSNPFERPKELFKFEYPVNSVYEASLLFDAFCMNKLKEEWEEKINHINKILIGTYREGCLEVFENGKWLTWKNPETDQKLYQFMMSE